MLESLLAEREIYRALARAMDDCGPTQHLLGNVAIDVEGETARSGPIAPSSIAPTSVTSPCWVQALSRIEHRGVCPLSWETAVRASRPGGRRRLLCRGVIGFAVDAVDRVHEKGGGAGHQRIIDGLGPATLLMNTLDSIYCEPDDSSAQEA